MASAARALPPVPEGFARFPIWPGAIPGAVPGGRALKLEDREVPRSPDGPVDDTAFVQIATPTLTMIRPRKSNGAALLLLPGGGYRRIAIGHEGYAIARRFAAEGYTCFILLYRLPADGWADGPDAPLQDAQRAMRIVRQRAAQEGYSPDRIGMIGFSAGGHLAARLATRFAQPTYPPVDAADGLSARPTVANLMYPVMTMTGPLVHAGSRDMLLGENPPEERLRALSPQLWVPADGPPTFLAHAADDATVPVGNSLLMFSALQAAKIPAEMHIFEKGGHGFGLTLPDRTTSPWPTLFMDWARRHGMP
ncbi:alpha/beta hydrolase [Sphingobium aquiterrae]|uniref:alpha/beta hydrolase n=1 Tax=Sphingobium aquiterrae TaxID=2038656 RepID=UPI003AFAD963